MPKLSRAVISISPSRRFIKSSGKARNLFERRKRAGDYLVEAGLNEAALTLASGEQRSGADLAELVKQARAIRAI